MLFSENTALPEFSYLMSRLDLMASSVVLFLGRCKLQVVSIFGKLPVCVDTVSQNFYDTDICLTSLRKGNPKSDTFHGSESVNRDAPQLSRTAYP